MCDPVSITAGISAATTLASAGAGYAAQSKQAKYAKKQALSQQRAQSQKIREDAAAKSRERAAQGRHQRARLAALAGESGITGASVDAQSQVSMYDQLTDQQVIRKNAQTALDNTATQAANRISRNPAPSLLATGLNVASSLTSNPAVQSAGSNALGKIKGGSTKPIGQSESIQRLF